MPPRGKEHLRLNLTDEWGFLGRSLSDGTTTLPWYQVGPLLLDHRMRGWVGKTYRGPRAPSQRTSKGPESMSFILQALSSHSGTLNRGGWVSELTNSSLETLLEQVIPASFLLEACRVLHGRIGRP